LTGHVIWPDGTTVPMAKVKADIVALSGYSAHADQAGLLDWVFDVRDDLRPINGRLVFIQHGGDAQRLALGSAIESRALYEGKIIQAISPRDPDMWFDLDRNASEISEELHLQQLEEEIARLSSEIARRRGTTKD
jgi:metallo-beta-lactamase family protein